MYYLVRIVYKDCIVFKPRQKVIVNPDFLINYPYWLSPYTYHKLMYDYDPNIDFTITGIITAKCKGEVYSVRFDNIMENLKIGSEFIMLDEEGNRLLYG